MGNFHQCDRTHILDYPSRFYFKIEYTMYKAFQRTKYSVENDIIKISVST